MKKKLRNILVDDKLYRWRFNPSYLLYPEDGIGLLAELNYRMD